MRLFAFVANSAGEAHASGQEIFSSLSCLAGIQGNIAQLVEDVVRTFPPRRIVVMVRGFLRDLG